MDLTAAAVRRSTSFMILSLSAAFAVRYNAETGFRARVDTAPLASVHTRGYVSTLYVPPPSIIASYSVLRHENRSNYEALLQQRCGPHLGSSSLSLSSISDLRVGINARNASNGRFLRPLAAAYPNKTSYVVLSDTVDMEDDLLPSCSLLGAVVDDDLAHMKCVVQAAATGETAWSEPANMEREYGSVNVGFCTAVQVHTEAAAGSFGSAHASLVSTHPNSSLWLSEFCSDLTSPRCDQAGRTLTVLSVPILPVHPVVHMLDTVLQARDSIVTWIHVPAALKPMVQLAVPNDSLSLAAMLASPTLIQGVPDRVYLNGSYITEATAAMRHGSLAPLLSKLSDQHVVFAGRRKRSRSGDVTELLDPTRALADVLANDRLQETAVQAVHAFALGPHVYLYVLRNEGEAISSLSRRSVTLTWTLGVLLSAMMASVPLLMAWRAKQAENSYNAKLDLSQAERDGIVQAVAFAAHEIRNPLHGILASLSAATTDLRPLHALLTRTFGLLDGSPPSSEDEEDMLQLYRLAEKLQGAASVRGVHNAFDDIAIAIASAESCHRLVNDMVDYSKLQRGVIQLHPMSMSVQKILHAAVASQRSFVGAGVALMYGIGPDVPPMLFADELRIVQVVANGLTNASKFTTMGSICLSVTAIDCSSVPEMRRDGAGGRHSWLAITITDTGNGLAGIDVDSLFEPVSNRHVYPRQDSPQSLSFSSLSVPSGPTCCRRRAPTRVAAEERVSPSAQRGVGRSAWGPEEADLSTSAASVIPATASALARTRGSGLGLPVARLMARALGGDCDLYPALPFPGEKAVGSTFLFLLPLDVVQKDSAGSLQPDSSALFGTSGRLSAMARQQVRRIAQASTRGLNYKGVGSRDYAGSSSSDLSGVPASPGLTVSGTSQPHLAGVHTNGARSYVASGSYLTGTGVVDPLPHMSLDSGVLTKPTGSAAVPSSATLPAGATLTSESDPISVNRTGVAHGLGTITEHSDKSVTTADAADNYTVQTDSMPAAARSELTPHGKTATNQLSTNSHSVHSFAISPGPIAVGEHMVAAPSTLSPQSSGTHTASWGTSGWQSSFPGPVLRVLYAEDDGTNRRLMGRMLQRVSEVSKQAMDVVCCRDGWEAIVQLHKRGHLQGQVLQQAQAACTAGTSLDVEESASPTDKDYSSSPFHLILLDLDMPRFTGDQVAALLSAERHAMGAQARGHTTVVAVTGRVKGFELKSTPASAGSLFGRHVSVSALMQLCPALHVVPCLSEVALEQAGFDGMLGKPFSQESLHTLCYMCVPDASGAAQA